MRLRDEGLRSEALREALAAALGGKTERLEDLLCRHGGGADPRPNLRLGAAFGAEIGGHAGAARRLLARFAADDADPETPRVFLPIAAVFGWAALLATDGPAAWEALGALAGDERVPVRRAVVEAVRACTNGTGSALALVAAATDWLGIEDLDARLFAASVAVETLGERRTIASLGTRPDLMTYLGRVMDEVVEAPRSAQRLEGRRLLLAMLPRTLTLVVAGASAAGRGGEAWFEDRCKSETLPDLRAALSTAILGLRAEGVGGTTVLVEHLRAIMATSAKPPRDPTLLRPGTGRGKASRAMK